MAEMGARSQTAEEHDVAAVHPEHQQPGGSGHRFSRGGASMLLAQAVKFLLQIGSMIVLARLLTPQDYGLFGIVLAITMYINLVKDLGLPTLTIQLPHLAEGQVNTFFWLNLTVGTALTLFLIALAPLFARLFAEPQLAILQTAMALTVVISASAAQPLALSKRQARFPVLALGETLSQLVGVSVAIAVAWFGGGAWALVAMHLTTAIGQAISGFWLSGWRPSRPERIFRVSPALKEGGRLCATAQLAHLVRNADTLLIGWACGTSQLGFYDKAYQLLLLPSININMPLSGVALSALSRAQHDPDLFRHYYRQVLQTTTSLGLPVVAFLAVMAEEVISLLLGVQWLDSVTLFYLLLPAAIIDTYLITVTWAFTALGQTERIFRVSLLWSIITLIGFVIGLSWGAAGVAAAFSLCRLGTGIAMTLLLCRQSPLRFRQFFPVATRSAAAALVAASVLWWGRTQLLAVFCGPSQIVVALALFTTLYLVVLILLSGGRNSLAEMGRTLTLFLQGQTTVKDQPGTWK